jgi:hypothetical protein
MGLPGGPREVLGVGHLPEGNGYKSVTRALQECYKSVTRVLQECCESVTRVPREALGVIGFIGLNGVQRIYRINRLVGAPR